MASVDLIILLPRSAIVAASIHFLPYYIFLGYMKTTMGRPMVVVYIGMRTSPLVASLKSAHNEF